MHPQGLHGLKIGDFTLPFQGGGVRGRSPACNTQCARLIRNTKIATFFSNYLLLKLITIKYLSCQIT